MAPGAPCVRAAPPRADSSVPWGDGAEGDRGVRAARTFGERVRPLIDSPAVEAAAKGSDRQQLRPTGKNQQCYLGDVDGEGLQGMRSNNSERG